LEPETGAGPRGCRFVIRWSAAGDFRIVTFEPGDWERTLDAWSAPISLE
jgi:hypothetical protein